MTGFAPNPEIEARFAAAQQALRAGGDAAAVIATCDSVLAASPGHFGALALGGIARLTLGDHDGAAPRLRAALVIDPAHATLWVNFGHALRRAHAPAAAIAAYDHALAVDSGLEPAARRRALALNLVTASPERTQAAARAWALAAGFAAAPPRPAPRDPDPDRPLRVGYLVEHILTHDYTLLPLVENHGPEVETAIYATRLPLIAELGARYQAAAALYRPLPGVSAAELAAQIRRDRIDILVEGAGLASPDGRLAALAARPAPIQIHFPVMATTGMAAVDAVLADQTLIPPEEEGAMVEQVERTPLGYHFNPLLPTPDPGPPPLLARGAPTFGSFNAIDKLRDETLATWAELLRQTPGARLIVKALDWSAAAERRARAVLGDAADQVEFRPPTPTLTGHYASFNDIDIALDTFPYGGVTTTAQALWMGVPVITMLGRRPLERYGAALCRAVGLDDLIARNPDDLIVLARRLAADPARLTAMRSTLRARMTAGPLGDGALFARGVEAAYRALWRRLALRG